MPIQVQQDLFGAPDVERTVRFINGNRIELTRRWAPGPTACVIGHNPSVADGLKDDPTCRWWMDWFSLFGFGGFTAVNLYPFVTPDPQACRRIVAGINEADDWAARDALHFVNLPAVVNVAKAADQVFVCWGAIAQDHDWIEHVVEEIQTGEEPWPDLWCWGKTASGAPKHPMARGKHRIPKDQQQILWRAK